MSSHKLAHSSDGHVSSRLEGWKVAIAVGSGVILAPVLGVVFCVLLTTALPVLPLLPTLFARFGSRSRPRALPPASVALAMVRRGGGDGLASLASRSEPTA